MTTDGHPTEGQIMALLDLQTIESEERTDGAGASTVSLLSCISAASVLLCL
ncbi:hypothetical protein GCM10010383_57800 [Streptomyces lomondensis]|uniref:AmfS protein n=2 Tax=Streptomyces TaxID=1883 RepID=A0ABQ2XLA2_9ACTN|nr:hypothetical protein GCM10010383_57800 [Streptomyces lomondensis]